MKEQSKILGGIVIVFGIICGFIMSSKFGVSISIQQYGIEEKRNMLLTIIIFVSVLFCSYVISVILFSQSEILENQEHIKHALYETDAHVNTLVKENKIKNSTECLNNGWKCPRCGRINEEYIGTCGCGYSKR